jgi:hypothetical protein
MGKTGPAFDPDAYAPVADRIRLFYQEYPTGRIRTMLVSRTDREVVFEARVYRSADDPEPAATGWAAEREGDGDINTVACLENTETSAIGRALANLGFTASRQRPSAEEMAKASRARMRVASITHAGTPASARAITRVPARVRETTLITKEQRANGITFDLRAAITADLLHLIARAEQCGVRARRTAVWREWLQQGSATVHMLGECERRLRAWLSRHDSLFYQ